MKLVRIFANFSSSAVFVLLCLVALMAPIPSASAAVPAQSPPAVEVVFVLDTTGSMGGLIAAAKEKIWSIANTLASADPAPRIRMGLVGYRDRGDAYVTVATPLTDDLDAVYAKLMQFQAAGGGDGPESVNQALHEAVTRMAWSDQEHRTYKVIFLVGDAPPHMDYRNDIRYPQTCRMAAQQGIIINTIQCGSSQETTPVWRKISQLAEGEFFQVAQSGSAVRYETPYDKKIASLSRDLDDTRLYYGDAAHLEKMEARTKLANKIYEAASPSAVAQRTVFNAQKAGARNFLGGQELIQAVEDGTIDPERIEKEQLPEDLRKMPPEKLKAYIDERIQKRKALRRDITELSKKRQQYIETKVSEDKAAGTTSFDAKVYKCIQAQAAGVDIAYSGGPAY